MNESEKRKIIIDKVAQALNSNYSKEGLAEFLQIRYNFDVNPSEIRNKIAFIKATILSFSNEELNKIAGDVGIDVTKASLTIPNNTSYTGERTTAPNHEPVAPAPESWAGVVFWLVANKKRAVAGLMIILIVGAGIVGTARLAGYDLFATFFPKLVKIKVDEFYDPLLQADIDTARAHGKSYIILSVTELVEIRDDSMKNVRQETVRNVYTLLMLKKLSKTEKSEFLESYTATGIMKVKRWFGTEKEGTDASINPYEVSFDAEAGDTHTLVTGATYTSPLMFIKNKIINGKDTALMQREEKFGYPNEDDIIRKIKIVLWSPTTRLKRSELAAQRLTDGNSALTDAAYSISEHDIAATSISATWDDLMPGEWVGLRFSW